MVHFLMIEFWALDNVCDITDSLGYRSQFPKGNVVSEVLAVDFVTKVESFEWYSRGSVL